jgi:hypothetical protein
MRLPIAAAILLLAAIHPADAQIRRVVQREVRFHGTGAARSPAATEEMLLRRSPRVVVIAPIPPTPEGGPPPGTDYAQVDLDHLQVPGKAHVLVFSAFAINLTPLSMGGRRVIQLMPTDPQTSGLLRPQVMLDVQSPVQGAYFVVLCAVSPGSYSVSQTAEGADSQTLQRTVANGEPLTFLLDAADAGSNGFVITNTDGWYFQSCDIRRLS